MQWIVSLVFSLFPWVALINKTPLKCKCLIHMLPILGTSFEFFCLVRLTSVLRLLSKFFVSLFCVYWILMSYLLLHKVRCEEGLLYCLSHWVLYQLSLLHAVLCGKAEESHACMPMKMEQLATKRTKTEWNTNMHRTWP